jgi:hypothetical protein
MIIDLACFVKLFYRKLGFFGVLCYDVNSIGKGEAAV